MLTISKLSKFYGEEKVLNEVSLEIADGEVLSVIGPSGSGKSTLLRCINELETYSEGEINLGSIAKNQVGMVFQSFNLFNNMSVMDNLIYAPVNVLKMKQKDAIDLGNKWLKKVGLEGFDDKYPASLSGGQKQRAAIARALCMEPKILLFDEPTSALDPENVREVTGVIKGLAHTGITMIVVTHIMSFAKSISDRIVFLEKWKVSGNYSYERVLKSPKTKRAQEFLKAIFEAI